MARIFVTGGGGFIGRNTIPQLLAQQHSVVALQRNSEIVPSEHPLLTIVHGDLTNAVALLRDAMDGCEIVLHLAGDTTPSRSATDMYLELQANLIPLLRLFDALEGSSVRRFVVLSSGGTVYGRPLFTPIDEDHPTIPTTPYGLGKLAAEHLTRLWSIQHDRKYILLRAANPYGPHQLGRNDQGVIGVWLQRVLRNEPLVVWGDGTMIRDYLYVGDLADALTIACTHAPLESGVYNIGSGYGNSLLQIAETIEQVTGNKPHLEFTPAKPYHVPINVLRSTLFHAATGWCPRISLLEGIRRTHRFLLENGYGASSDIRAS
jgi:UDP-glucose 4-epimerase